MLVKPEKLLYNITLEKINYEGKVKMIVKPEILEEIYLDAGSARMQRAIEYVKAKSPFIFFLMSSSSFT